MIPAAAAGTVPGGDPSEGRAAWADRLTVGVGAVGAAAGTVPLVVTACREGGASRIVGACVFGGSLFLAYLISTLYHSLERTRAGPVLGILDHAAIFLLIAGTYTPFTLVTLRGAWGWSLFGVVWGLGLAGVVYKAFFAGRHGLFSTGLYIGLGWMAVVALKPLSEALASEALLLLFSGGVSYSLGTVFYHWKGLRYGHAVWHLFVLAGSFLHYFAVLFFVIPGKA